MVRLEVWIFSPRRTELAARTYKPEEIVLKLRQADVLNRGDLIHQAQGRRSLRDKVAAFEKIKDTRSLKDKLADEAVASLRKMKTPA